MQQLISKLLQADSRYHLPPARHRQPGSSPSKQRQRQGGQRSIPVGTQLASCSCPQPSKAQLWAASKNLVIFIKEKATPPFQAQWLQWQVQDSRPSTAVTVWPFSQWCPQLRSPWFWSHWHWLSLWQHLAVLQWWWGWWAELSLLQGWQSPTCSSSSGHLWIWLNQAHKD